LVSVVMRGHDGAQFGELLREPDEPVVLRLLLRRAIVEVVEVLLPAGLVDAGGLHLRGRSRRDRDAGPCGRDREPFDPLELRRVRDPTTARVVVAEGALPAVTYPPMPNYTAQPMRNGNTIVVLEGDQTGQELLEEALRVLASDVIGVELQFPRFDLSLESRRATGNAVVHDAAAAVREHGLGLKAATVTPEGGDDVGSPNRILREEIGGKVIVRTGRRIPGVVPLGGVFSPISIVRMAVGDAYGATEWREGEGEAEVAFRTERIERSICHAVAEFAFRQAERTGAKVFGGPKYTVSPLYEGMLKEEMDAAAERHPDVQYEPQLIDATFALLISSAGDPLVIPALNRDGDILSDLVLPLFGSIAGSESLLVAFEHDFEPSAIMAEAAHGTAPSLEGKNVANPMAMILAGAALLSHGGERTQEAGRAIREACLEAVAAGRRTSDLGGHLGTTEFTDEVIARTRAKLEVWAAL
jgi:isocitrate dehydrogenase (NAD+)